MSITCVTPIDHVPYGDEIRLLPRHKPMRAFSVIGRVMECWLGHWYAQDGRKG